jgi:hypothetical protein
MKRKLEVKFPNDKQDSSKATKNIMVMEKVTHKSVTVI